MKLTSPKTQIIALICGLLLTFIGIFPMVSRHFRKVNSVAIELDNTHGEILDGAFTEVTPSPTSALTRSLE